ncbi:MAG: hypothetical protein IJL26_06700, partial [Clostridia bacterium]|nr:hypothetical protein [Clostridia bacterium]
TAAPTVPTTVPTTAAPVDRNKQTFERFVKAINGSRYRMDGYMINGSERTPLSMICYGNNIRMSSNFEGKSLDIAIVDGKIYLINNDAHTYMILNSIVASAMKINIDDLKSDNFNFNIGSADSATRTATEFDGQPAEKFTVTAGSGEMDVYIVDGQIKRFEKSDGDPEHGAIYELNSFSDEVSPEDVAPNADYEKQSMFAFMGDMM